MNVKFEILTKTNVCQTINFIQKQFDYASNNLLFKDLKRHFLKDVLTNPSKHIFWIIKSKNNKVIATIGLTSTLNQTNQTNWWIDWFAVSPKFRGNGIGKECLKLAESEAKKRNIKKINIYTSTSEFETSANHLYEKHGYKIWKKFSETEADGTKVYGLFRKKML